jgi:DNA modification methylase
LAEKVITYYSFKGDVVLDPFAGSGTVGLAATSLDRRFVLFESNFNYIELMQQTIPRWKNVKVFIYSLANWKPSKLLPIWKN